MTTPSAAPLNANRPAAPPSPSAAARHRTADAARAARFHAAMRAITRATLDDRWGPVADLSSPAAARAGPADGPARQPQDVRGDAHGPRDPRTAGAEADAAGSGHDTPRTRFDGGRAVAARAAEEPLTIRALNDLLLLADPVLLASRRLTPTAGRGTSGPNGPSAGAPGVPEPQVRRGGGRPPDPGPADAVPAPPRGATPAEQGAPAPPATAAAAVQPRPQARPVATAERDPASTSNAPQAASRSAPSGVTASPAASVLPVAPIRAGPAGGEPRAEPQVEPRPAVAALRPAGPGPTGPRLPIVREAPLPRQPATAEQHLPLGQVARALAAALAKDAGPDGERSIMLRLEPESLGQLRVVVTMQGNTVAARFEARSEQARDLLDRSLATLRSSLEERGLHVDRLHVGLAAADPAGAQPARPLSGEPSPAWNAGHEPSGDWSGADQSSAHDGTGSGHGGAERPPNRHPHTGTIGGAESPSHSSPGPGPMAAYLADGPWPWPASGTLILVPGIDTLA